MTRPSVVRVLSSSALALAGALSMPVHAADLAPLLDRVDGATDVTVILVPPMAIFRDPLDERALQAAGCRYRITEPAALRTLVQLLRGSDLRGSEVYKRPDAREAVYLTTADGGQLRFLFADNAGSRVPVDGVLEAGSGGNAQFAAFRAGDRLPTELRRWTATHGGVGTGSACERQAGVTEPTAPPKLP